MTIGHPRLPEHERKGYRIVVVTDRGNTNSPTILGYEAESLMIRLRTAALKDKATLFIAVLQIAGENTYPYWHGLPNHNSPESTT